VISDALYETIKKHLQKAKEPLTCNDLLDKNDFRQLDDVSSDDVSNALAALWRRGLLERFSVHRGHGRGPRYSYKLRTGKTLDVQHQTANKPLNVDRLQVQHSDDGSVTFTTDRLVITVRPTMS
jgi:predicted transcriptional regulator